MLWGTFINKGKTITATTQALKQYKFLTSQAQWLVLTWLCEIMLIRTLKIVACIRVFNQVIIISSAMYLTSQLCFLNMRIYLIYLCCYLLIMVAAGTRVVNGLKCYCNQRECDVIRSFDCPGKGLMLWDPCKCCRICAKTQGESCGGPGEFSGQCEPPLQCVTKLPITSGLGVCMNLPLSSPYLTFQYENCTKDETIEIQSGCEITNKRCQCWPKLYVCRTEEINGIPILDSRWHFKTLEDCQLNLYNLIKIDMEFDEDYTISPSSFTYKNLKRKRRSYRKRRIFIET